MTGKALRELSGRSGAETGLGNENAAEFFCADTRKQEYSGSGAGSLAKADAAPDHSYLLRGTVAPLILFREKLEVPPQVAVSIPQPRSVTVMQKERKNNKKRSHRPRGSVYFRDDSPFAYISYSVHGRRIKENTRQTSVKVARKMLDSRLGAVASGDVLPVDVARTSIGELLELVRTDYKVNALKSLDDMERRTKLHIAPFFFVIVDEDSKFTGGMRATQVTTDSLNRYVVARQGNGASNGSVNRELSILRRGFTLGMTATPPKVLRSPNFPRLKESAPRKGFLEDAQFDAIVRACPELWFRAFTECARTFGWRSDELKQLRCEQVDLINRVIRLNPGSTKNGDARSAAMTDAVYTLLRACCDGKKGSDRVFTRPSGKPVLDFRQTWRRCCVAAGVGRWTCKQCGPSHALNEKGECENCGQTWKPRDRRYRGALVHDFRRTAVRAMTRRGIPERVAMTISGHRTRSIFDRYNIVSEQDLRDAARRMEPRPTRVEICPVSVPVAPFPAPKTVN